MNEEIVLATIDFSQAREGRVYHDRYSDGYNERTALKDWVCPLHSAQWRPSMQFMIKREGDELVLFQRSQSDHALLTGAPEWRDYAIEAQIRQFMPRTYPDASNGYSMTSRNGLMLRFQDVRRYYYYCLEGYDRVTLYRREDHSFQVLGTEFVAINRAGYHCLRAVAEGDRITCFFDGQPVIVAFDDCYPQGPAGIRSNAVASYKAIKVATSRAAHTVYFQTRDAAARELDEVRETYPRPVLWKTVPLQKAGEAGELQLGRFGNGQAWGVARVARDADGVARRLVALDLEGEVLWERPWADDVVTGSLKIADVDNDGVEDLVLMTERGIRVISGVDGSLKAETGYPPAGPLFGKPGTPAALTTMTWYCPRLRPEPAGLDIVAGDGDGGGGWNIWVYDDKLNLRWTYHFFFPFGHNFDFYDVDGDGRNEIAAGYDLISPDGETIWRVEEAQYYPWYGPGVHVDRLVVGDLAGSGDPRDLTVAMAAGDDGLLFVDAQTGRIKSRHTIGHVQVVSMARWRKDLPGLQVYAMTRHNNNGIVALYDAQGRCLHRHQPSFVAEGGLPVNWRGDDEELLSLGSTTETFGLWDSYGRKVVPPPDEVLELRREGRAGLLLPIDLTGDPRDELVYTCGSELRIYTQDRPPLRPRCYAPRKAHWRSTLAVASYPGWL